MNKEKDTRVAKDFKVGDIAYDVFEQGIRFIIMRGPASFCAYVGIPESHPLAGHEYDDIIISCHGGLTFSGTGEQWPKGFYWYGWDYAHLGDRTVYDGITEAERLIQEKDHNWTVGEIIDDSWDAMYDFKKLIKLAEKIANK